MTDSQLYMMDGWNTLNRIVNTLPCDKCSLDEGCEELGVSMCLLVRDMVEELLEEK